MKKLILIFTSVVILTPSAKAQQSTSGDDFKTKNSNTKTEKQKKEESDEKAFKEGSIAVTVGYGFPDIYKSYVKGIVNNFQGNGAVYSVKGIGPAFLKAEYGLSKLIGLGAVIAYHNISVSETYTYQDSYYNSVSGTWEYGTYEDVEKLTYTSLSAAVRINFHFGTGKRLDPYAGVAAGYSQKQYKFTYSTNNPNGLSYVPQTYEGVFPVYFAMSAGLRYYFTPNIGIYGEVGFDKWSVLQGGLAITF